MYMYMYCAQPINTQIGFSTYFAIRGTGHMMNRKFMEFMRTS